MDISDTWLEHILRDILPAPYLAAIEAHILHPHSPFQLFKRQTFLLLNRCLNIAYPFIMPVATRLTSLAHSSPDVVFFAAVLSVLYVAVLMLAWMRRVMMFWMRVAVHAAGLALVVLLVAVAWQRGLEQSGLDLWRMANTLVGYAEVVRDVWVREYERYQEQERVQSARGGR